MYQVRYVQENPNLEGRWHTNYRLRDIRIGQISDMHSLTWLSQRRMSLSGLPVQFFPCFAFLFGHDLRCLMSVDAWFERCCRRRRSVEIFYLGELQKLETLWRSTAVTGLRAPSYGNLRCHTSLDRTHHISSGEAAKLFERDCSPAYPIVIFAT